MSQSNVHSPALAELVKIARYAVQRRQEAEKQAFVDAATVGGGGGGGMPPMDPAMMGGGGGGMPPMDPAMMGGGGGMPPMDPAMMGGGGGAPPGITREEVQAMIQQAVGAGGAGAGAAGPALKPKIDVNVEMLQIKKLLARIADALGIHIPAQDMVATPDDLMQMAQQQGGGGGGGASAGGGSQGTMPPIQPMPSARPEAGQQKAGSLPDEEPYDGRGLLEQASQATAMHHWMRSQRTTAA